MCAFSWVATRNKFVAEQREKQSRQQIEQQSLRLLMEHKNDSKLIAEMIQMTKDSEEGGTEEIRNRLERYLEKESFKVGRYAAITLGKLRIRESLPALLQACSVPELQEAALHALRLIDGGNIERTTAKLLREGTESLRREAILTIEKRGIRSPEIEAELRKAAGSGEGISSRMAEQALKRLRNKSYS